MTSKNIEPLLTDDDNRYVMFPIQDKSIWDMYKKSVDCFWRAEEIDLSKDKASWNKMSDEERYFVKMILAFFAASDGIVLENLGMRFMSEVQLSEARAFYGFQIMMENIHSEVYSLLIDTYVEKEDEKNKLFSLLNAKNSREKVFFCPFLTSIFGSIFCPFDMHWINNSLCCFASLFSV